MATDVRRNDGDEWWAQTRPAVRESKKTPLPDVDDLPAGPQARDAFEITNGLRIGELELNSRLHRQMDGWVGKGTKNTYDPDAVYTRASNRFDHAQTLSVRVPPEVVAVMDQLIERIPEVNNRTEFVRDAIVHGLFRWAARMEEMGQRSWRNMVELEVARCVQDRMKMELGYWRQLVDEAEKTLEEAAREGDAWALNDAIDFHDAMAERSPEPWKGRLEEVVRRYRGRKG